MQEQTVNLYSLALVLAMQSGWQLDSWINKGGKETLLK